MKGDFSRYRFDPTKHYSAVLEQQGRVQLDADANEQRAIDAHRLVTETIDVIGATGAPQHAAGFAISLRADKASLLIGPGRYYVDGLLCEAAAQSDYTQQPYLIGPQPGIDAMLADLRAGRASAIQVWLEAWQRMATPIDDPCIKDPALGEADTTVRVQTIWRVVAEEAAATGTGQTAAVQAVQGLRQAVAAFQQLARSTALDSVAAHADTLAGQVAAGSITDALLVSSLTALHTEAIAAVSNLTRLPADTGMSLVASIKAIATVAGATAPEDCCAAMRSARLALPPGEMTASTGDTSSLGPCLPSPQAAYRGLENQLYRIEVHQGGALADATYKWSRDNGSVVSRITEVSGKVVTVDSLGPDSNLGFAALQWVEISDDSDEFGPTPNQPGQLRQIQCVDFAHNRITLTETAPAVDTTNGHAKLRRWDQTDANATNAGVPMAPGGWHSLENGIQVQFSDALPFQPGDYWLVPARTATGEVEWPPCGSDGANYQPARNTIVYRAPLACIDWELNSGGFVPHDCRDFFYPLTELAPPPTETALHVTAINWANDDVQTLDQLFAGGLNVTLDGTPVSGIDPARFIVTLELPLSLDQFTNEASALILSTASGLLRSGMVVDGVVSVTGSTITWSLPRNLYFYFAQALESLSEFANQQQYVRARVLVKGRLIWGAGAGAMPFLDGQCFGVSATRSDGRTPRTDLVLPSGADAKASDFESWFYLAPLPRVLSLSAAPPAVAWVPIPGATTLHLVDVAHPTVAAAPVLNVSLNYNAIADTQVAISVTGGTPGIVTVQSPVTIPRGAVSPVQPIPLSVGNTGENSTQSYTLAAAVELSSGVQFPVQTTFAVTGHARPGPAPLFTGPISPTQPPTPAGSGGTRRRRPRSSG
jgi:hypothetical protein